MPSAISSVISSAAPLAFTLVLATAGPLSAHSSLLSSDPKNGASIASSPTSVSFTFNEDISEPAFVAVKAPDGSDVTVSDITVEGAIVTATVAANDQRGRFTASYRVVSTDGHPVEGDIRYTTTAGRKVTQVEPAEDNSFLARHSAHIFWGILVAAVLVGLLLVPLRGRDEPDDA